MMARAPELRVRVEAAGASANRADASLPLIGMAGPPVLVGVGANGARAILLVPVHVTFAIDTVGAVPGILALALVVALVGQGAVVVIPATDPEPWHELNKEQSR